MSFGFYLGNGGAIFWRWLERPTLKISKIINDLCGIRITLTLHLSYNIHQSYCQCNKTT